MRTNSSILGGAYNNSITSQPSFSSIAMSRSQFNSSDLLSNISNVSSLLNYSFGNEMVGSGGRINLPPLNVQQQENMSCSETNDVPFTASSVPIHGQQFQKPSVNQHGLDHPQFQQQFSFAHGQQLEGLNNMNSGDQNGSVQLISRSLAPIKTENQISEPKILLQQQQQQQQQQTQHVQMLRQSSQVAAQRSILQQHQQQRLLQLQQQQQIVNNFPLQRSHLQQQIQQQSVSVRPQLKPTGYEPGICARRLTHYMYHQQHRPEDNNIEFWKKFISEYFAPNARKRWCVSLYGSVRQTTGVFPQDAWHCEICSCKPGRGFETTVEVLPRLCQIKYASGTLEELLYVDMPHEYLNASGQIVLDYAKAIQESVFDQLRVVRNGQLRIVFNQDLKIASWEFCARRHEELIPRRTIIQQVSQLGAAIHKYQAAAQTASNLSTQDLQIACNSFIASARQLAKSLEVPLVNDLGYTKRYVRCLQISEVVNSMKDLIDYSRETGAGPMDSLINFPKRANPSSAPNYQQTQQQHIAQNLNQTNQNSPHPKGIQNALCNSGLGANNSFASTASISASTPSINSILLQNSINSKQDYPLSTLNSPYGNGNTVQISSASSSSLPSSLNNNSAPPPSHFSSRNSFSNSPATHQSDPSDSQSSSQQTLHEMLISSSENELKVVGGTARGGLTGSLEFDGMSGGFTSTVLEAGMRVGIGSNSMPVSGRIGISNISQNLVGMSHYQQQDMGSRLLGTLGAAGQWLQ